MIILFIVIDTLIFRPVTIYPMKEYNKTIFKSGKNTLILRDTCNYPFNKPLILIK